MQKKYFDGRSQQNLFKLNIENIRKVRWVGKNSEEEKETIYWKRSSSCYVVQ